VGEAVDPYRAVATAHNTRLASPVFCALERVGEGGALEPGGVRQHVGDGSAGQVIVVEL
jgi:hypothetical protein